MKHLTTVPSPRLSTVKHFNTMERELNTKKREQVMFISLQHSKLLGYANLGKMSLVIETLIDVRLAMFDTHVFLLNEYFIE